MIQTFERWMAAAALAVCCTVPAAAQHFTMTKLTSDTGVDGTKTDANLVNAWGMSRATGSPWWISDNGTNHSTLYTGDGTAVPLVVSVPGGPTGTVFNGSRSFGLNGRPAAFLFATEAGTILGWNGGTAAMQVASKGDAVYKGLARGRFAGADYLYAADFHNGVVDVLDSSFGYVQLSMLAQKDGGGYEPFMLPGSRWKGYSPFNIQNIGGNLYVTFAKPDAAGHDEVDGAGLGVVAVFSPAGRLLRVFETGAWLNAPWGLALAPGDFGSFSHCLLVGNFGSGQIAAYNLENGHFVGMFLDGSGTTLSIDGLWGLSFGSDNKAGAATSLYFTAGPNGESHGLFGMLTPAAADLTQGNGN